MEDGKLTAKQRAFVEAYAGNATAAALAAGYSKKSARVQGRRLITNDNVAKAIKEREAQRFAPMIASRQERQEFWTAVLRDAGQKMVDRLRAAELLGKSEGDFLERVEMEHSGGLDLRAEVRAAILERQK